MVEHSVTEAVAAELRAEKGRKRVSQQALADAIGRAQSYVSKRLSGDASLTVDEFVTLCLALDVRPEELLANALSKYHGVIWGGEPAIYVQMQNPDGSPRRPTQADVAPAAENRDGTDPAEGDYDSGA